MSKERSLIHIVDSILPKSPSSHTQCFERDAELVVVGDEPLLVSTDGFSREDLLREDDPFSLGWNIAVGALSDILASGGTPLFYAHAISLDSRWTETFLKMFAKGVSRALMVSGTIFAGGDMGRSKEWKVTATVIGRAEGKPILRKGASPGEALYISGKVGTGNLEAAMSIYSDRKGIRALSSRVKNKFVLRLAEAQVMRKYATCCIDTSDGLFDALNTISEINGTGYIVEDLPYIKMGVWLGRALGLPRFLLFFGGCGEYELLFTVRKELEKSFLREAKSKGLRFYRLGTLTPGKPSFRILKEEGRIYNLTDLRIDARDFDSLEDYLDRLLKEVEALKCPDES